MPFKKIFSPRLRNNEIKLNKPNNKNAGEIAEEGTHQELVEQGGIYSKLVQRQIQNMQNKLEQGADAKDTGASDLVDSLLDDGVCFVCFVCFVLCSVCSVCSVLCALFVLKFMFKFPFI
jgi:hypothetical protein